MEISDKCEKFAWILNLLEVHLNFSLISVLGIHFWLVAFTFRKDLLDDAGGAYELAARA